MKVLIFLAIVATAHGLLGSRKPGLRVRFDLGLAIGTKFFIDIPQTATEAKAQNWQAVDRPQGLKILPQLVLYCYSDHVLCAFYDDTEYVAGLQIGLSDEEFTDAVFDMNVQGYTSWTTTVNGVKKHFWTIQQYFVSEESFQKSKEERLAARNTDKTLQENAVWVTGFNGELLKVSSSAQEINDNSPFTRQSCIPWMGRHYYYNMTESTECTADGMFPWFPLVDSGELIATGFLTFGKITIKQGQRNWFENPPLAIVKLIVPHGPQCMYDLVTKTGAVTMHIYYIDKPWLIGCLLT
ncbi:uncharacterized protein LOC115452772 [Manduca sexta]|uniref:uncharacterized protein LOC115452772 n=1 Tax=Manduca sexta TaxID=7130 RepID=UPI00188E8F0A|nr:uncharacterized protein LOC115452772 [Manduca sexta]